MWERATSLSRASETGFHQHTPPPFFPPLSLFFFAHSVARAACLSGHRLSPATAPPTRADLTQSEAQGAADATFCHPCSDAAAVSIRARAETK